MITDVVLLELDPLLVRDLQYVGFDEGIFTASSVKHVMHYQLSVNLSKANI